MMPAASLTPRAEPGGAAPLVGRVATICIAATALGCGSVSPSPPSPTRYQTTLVATDPSSPTPPVTFRLLQDPTTNVLRYTAVNTGSRDPVDVTFSFAASDGRLPLAVVPGQGDCAPRGHTVVCDLGMLAPGGSITTTLEVPPNDTTETTSATLVAKTPTGAAAQGSVSAPIAAKDRVAVARQESVSVDPNANPAGEELRVLVFHCGDRVIVKLVNPSRLPLDPLVNLNAIDSGGEQRDLTPLIGTSLGSQGAVRLSPAEPTPGTSPPRGATPPPQLRRADLLWRVGSLAPHGSATLNIDGVSKAAPNLTFLGHYRASLPGGEVKAGLAADTGGIPPFCTVTSVPSGSPASSGAATATASTTVTASSSSTATHSASTASRSSDTTATASTTGTITSTETAHRTGASPMPSPRGSPSARP